MLLSSILKRNKLVEKYRIVDEKSFDYLALAASTISEKNCIFLDNENYINMVSDFVTMVITNSEIASMLLNKKYGLCVVEKPREVFFELHNYLADSDSYKRDIYDTKIGRNSNISPLASLAKQNVIIGNNAIIEEFAVIRENTIIGDNTIIRAGVVVGGQGFEFKRFNSEIFSVVHVGGVKIGNHVEIQYHTCIDRAVYPWDNTEIGDYSKIDNLVHIAHGVKIGNNVMVVANCGIGGRAIVKNNAWIGFSSTIINGVTVGENARVNMGAVVTQNVPDGGSVTGNFAIQHSKFIENLKEQIK